MNNNLTQKRLNSKLEMIAIFALIFAFILPIISFAGDDKIFVDGDYDGVEEGTASQPYKTISKALKNSDSNTKVIVEKGTYKENIKIPKGVEVHGVDRNDVIIKADDDDDPVVEMKDDTKISKVTIRGGKVGIKVGRDHEDISIVKCIIKDNDKDGIKLEKGSTSKKDAVSITESKIKDNGKSGIYSKKRRVVLMDNEIYDNDRDGVDLEAGVSAWIQNNEIRDNEGSGMKFTLDDSKIWTKGNKIKNNDHEGIEIKAFGEEPGRIDISKSDFKRNDNYGVARVQEGYVPRHFWDSLTFDDRNTFIENKLGAISSIIQI